MNRNGTESVNHSKSIGWYDWCLCRLFQLTYPLLHRIYFAPPELEFATKKIDPAKHIRIHTRHGNIDALLFSPTKEDIHHQQHQGSLPPMHMITHGGAFILQYPHDDENIARYLASEVGCYVLIPDYTAAPQAQFPVAEEQCFDAFRWAHSNASHYGWDADRISIGGASAGGKLALSVALAAIQDGGFVPVAVTSEYGVADVSRSNQERTSAKKGPIVGSMLMDLVRNTYFKGTDLKSSEVSPIYHSSLNRLPPTLIITAEYDTLRQESNDLAYKLSSLGVSVTHKEFERVDHGFTHQLPIEPAREAIEMIGNHIRTAYTSRKRS